MLLPEVMKAVEQLSLDELRQLREYIQEREQQVELRAGTIVMDEFLSALEELRAGLTKEEFEKIERAMNEEYVESLDSEP
jgi:hypothetical protein